jgi:hypothetical protein
MSDVKVVDGDLVWEDVPADDEGNVFAKAKIYGGKAEVEVASFAPIGFGVARLVVLGTSVGDVVISEQELGPLMSLDQVKDAVVKGMPSLTVAMLDDAIAKVHAMIESGELKAEEPEAEPEEKSA